MPQAIVGQVLASIPTGFGGVGVGLGDAESRREAGRMADIADGFATVKSHLDALENQVGTQKTVAGEVTFTGSKTDIATGLASIAAVSLAIKKATAPGADGVTVTYDTSTGTLKLYAWKVTAADNAALIAADAPCTIAYVAHGAP
jgi:hypothetical protein